MQLSGKSNLTILLQIDFNFQWQYKIVLSASKDVPEVQKPQTTQTKHSIAIYRLLGFWSSWPQWFKNPVELWCTGQNILPRQPSTESERSWNCLIPHGVRTTCGQCCHILWEVLSPPISKLQICGKEHKFNKSLCIEKLKNPHAHKSL